MKFVDGLRNVPALCHDIPSHFFRDVEARKNLHAEVVLTGTTTSFHVAARRARTVDIPQVRVMDRIVGVAAVIPSSAW